MPRVQKRKHTYWHQLAKLLIINGYKPAQCAKILKSVFPDTEVNGRHIGAYKRRLIDAGVIDKHAPTVGSIGELIQLADNLVSAEDKFVYDCYVGSIRRSLKCFEYKLTEAQVDELDEIDIWIEKLN